MGGPQLVCSQWLEGTGADRSFHVRRLALLLISWSVVEMMLRRVSEVWQWRSTSFWKRTAAQGYVLYPLHRNPQEVGHLSLVM